MNKKRIAWIDIIKYICIMCVMNSHLESTIPILETFYTPFFLMAFFFCSGYTYHAESKFGIFFKRKVQQLFIPWLIFSVANILLSHILSFNDHLPLEKEMMMNFLQIRGEGDGVWFVAALFVAFIPFYFFIRWHEKKPDIISRRWLLAISLLLSIVSTIYSIEMNPMLLPWNAAALPWHIEYVFVAMFYMVLGYLFRTNYEQYFDKYNTTVYRILIWGLYLCATFVGEYFAPYIYLNNAWNYLERFLGVVAVVSLSKVLPENRAVLYIGQNTLLCFALHGKVYSLLQTILKKIIPDIYASILNNWLLSFPFSILLTILLSVILLVPVWFINRWFPFLIGRKRKKSSIVQ